MAGHTALAGQLGYTQQEITALDDPAARGTFPQDVQVALRYAELATRDAHLVTNEFFAELRRHYSDRQILEITCVIGLSNYFNKFTTALRVDLSGSDLPYDP